MGDMFRFGKVMAGKDFGKSGNPLCEYYTRAFKGRK
jgi:hypothetical protein